MTSTLKWAKICPPWRGSLQDLEKNNYEIRFPVEKLTDRMMIIYMDVFGNERKEVLNKKDFKKKAK